MVKHAGAAGPDAEQSNPPEEKKYISIIILHLSILTEIEFKSGYLITF